MIFILDLLRKIQEDKREDPKAYLIIYKESNSTKELKFDNIKDINKLYVIFELENKQFTVPVHRIREIRKENKSFFFKKNNFLGIKT